MCQDPGCTYHLEQTCLNPEGVIDYNTNARCASEAELTPTNPHEQGMTSQCNKFAFQQKGDLPAVLVPLKWHCVGGRRLQHSWQLPV